MFGFDPVFDDDGVARVCLNRIPQKFKDLLSRQGHHLSVIVDQVRKIKHDPKVSFWSFP